MEHWKKESIWLIISVIIVATIYACCNEEMTPFELNGETRKEVVKEYLEEYLECPTNTSSSQEG